MNRYNEQAFQDPLDNWTQGTSRDQYQRGGAFLRNRGQQRSRPRGRQTQSRVIHQARRVETNRHKVGEANQDRYDKAIREKLLAGLKDEASGIATKEAAMLTTAIPLQISTRQIGFGLAKMANSSSIHRNAETLINANHGTTSQYYRVALGLVEAKLHKTAIRVTEAVDETNQLPDFKHDPEFLNLRSSVTIFPEPISNFVNSIGIKTRTPMTLSLLQCRQTFGIVETDSYRYLKTSG